MPGQRIKFRRSYLTSVIGENVPHDSLQWSHGRKPRFKSISVNEDLGRTCLNCQHEISVGARYYATRTGSSLHELC